MSNDQYKNEVINPGDEASKIAKDICFKTHDFCPAVKIIPRQSNSFRGGVDFIWRDHILQEMIDGKMRMSVENDGAGGKPQFFTLLNTPEAFKGLGWEIIEMVAGDFARSGRFPAVIDNEMNVKKVTKSGLVLFKATMEGYADALKETNLVNITGEVAIMKHSITAFCDDGSDDQFILTWGASCLGLSHPDHYIDGSEIKPGMVIVGFYEPGYRCNGGTFFTNVLLKKFGPKISQIRENDEAMDFVKQLTIPSKGYTKTITRLVGWTSDGRLGEPMAEIAGIAHITGGGVWGKFGELLPTGVGACLNSMPEPAPVLLKGQEFSWDIPGLRLNDWQAYGTLHGGCGMVLVCKTKQDAQIVIREAQKDGVQAQVIGKTFESMDNEIVIHSKFREYKILSSLRPE